MAFTLQDGAQGLVPIRTPLESQTQCLPVANAQYVYPGQIVGVSSGEVAAAEADDSGPLFGVALEYGLGVVDNSVKVTVCTDPEMVYKALSDEAIASTTYGQYLVLASNGGNTATKLGTGVLDGSAITATMTADTYLTFLGEYEGVNVGTNLWYKVKLNALTTDVKFDLDTDT